MRRAWEELKFGVYLMAHPFKGFWGLKFEKRGTVKAAIVYLLLFCFSSIASGLFTGYLFNLDGGLNYNLYENFFLILLLFFLWCIGNWCLTSLFDGTGTFRDIFIATSFSLLPYSFVQLLLIPLSHVLAQTETSFYQMIMMIGIIWTAGLLCCSVIVTHQYSLLKSLLTIVCTLLSMCVIAYILLLFFHLIEQIYAFVVIFWREWTLRLV